MQKTNINMLKEGSILSESSHYIVLGTPVGALHADNKQFMNNTFKFI